MNPTTSASTKSCDHCSIQVIRQLPSRGEGVCRAAFGLTRLVKALAFGTVLFALGFPLAFGFGVLSAFAAVPRITGNEVTMPYRSLASLYSSLSRRLIP